MQNVASLIPRPLQVYNNTHETPNINTALNFDKCISVLKIAFLILALLGPPMISTQTMPYELSRGANITLDCQYTSNPIQRLYKWEHRIIDQIDVLFENSTSDHYTVTAYSLTINDITADDAGLYMCNVTNQCGSDGVNFVLDVIGKSKS